MMKRLPWLLIGVLAALGLLAACADSGLPTPLPPPLIPSTAPTQAAPSSPEAGARPITFLESGGWMVTRRTLTLGPTGAALVTDDRGVPIATWQVPADQWVALQAQIAAVNFATLAARYDQENVGDDTYWTVTVQQGGQTYSVFVAETGGESITPASLKDLIAALRRLATDTRAQGTPLPTLTPPPTPPPTVTPTMPPPAPTQAPVPPSPTAGPLVVGSPITFLESGGYVGIRRTLTLGPTGAALVTDDRGVPAATWQVPADQWAALQAQIAAINFATLAARYDQGNVADDIYWTVTVQQGGQTRSVFVAAAGGESITPAGLKDLIATLRRLSSATQTQGTPLPMPTSGANN